MMSFFKGQDRTGWKLRRPRALTGAEQDMLHQAILANPDNLFDIAQRFNLGRDMVERQASFARQIGRVRR